MFFTPITLCSLIALGDNDLPAPLSSLLPQSDDGGIRCFEHLNSTWKELNIDGKYIDSLTDFKGLK